MSLLDTLPIWCAVNALHRLRRRYVGPGFVLRLLSPRRHEEARRPSTRSAAPWRAHVAVDRTGAARAVPQEPLEGAPSMNSSLPAPPGSLPRGLRRSEEHTSELQSLMRISYAVFCLKKTTTII